MGDVAAAVAEAKRSVTGATGAISGDGTPAACFKNAYSRRRDKNAFALVEVFGDNAERQTARLTVRRCSQTQ